MDEELIAIPISEYEDLLNCKKMLEDKFAEEKVRMYQEYETAVQQACFGVVDLGTINL